MTQIKAQEDLATSVFLSYSRKDLEIAEWLKKQLQNSNFRVYQDLPDTLPGEEWWSRIKELILNADQVIFLMSANATSSNICAEEIAYAVSLNKRIFPVIVEDIDWKSVPEGLARIHSVYLDNIENGTSVVQTLIQAMNTNIGWIREHNRLLNRAMMWKLKNRLEDELLSGKVLQEAEEWLMAEPPINTYPTTLHQEFITSSRNFETEKKDEELRYSEEQRKILKAEKTKVENNFRAGLDVISDIQYYIIENLNNTRGISAKTQENIIKIILDASERLKNNDPDFYPSSVQMQLAENELRAVSSLTDALHKQGRFEEAENTAQRALRLAEEFRLDEYNPFQRRPGLRQTAQLLGKLSEIYFRQNEFTKAKEFLEEAKDIQEKCLAYYSKYSGAEDFRSDLLETLHRESVLYIVTGQKQSALEVSRKALEHAIFLEKSSKKGDYSLNVAMIKASVADALCENNIFDEATEKLEEAISVLDERLSNFPDELFSLYWKSLILERLGNIAMIYKNYNEALEIYHKTLNIKKQLMEADEDHVQYKNDYSIILRKYNNVNAMI